MKSGWQISIYGNAGFLWKSYKTRGGLPNENANNFTKTIKAICKEKQ